MGSLNGRVSRLEGRMPDVPRDARQEERQQIIRVLNTAVRLIHEDREEANRDYRERMARGESAQDALMAAKRAVWSRTEEGREVLALFDAVKEKERGA